MAKGTPIADLGDQPARRQILTQLPTGDVVTERVPSGRFIKVVKPSGSVARVPVHNGRASRQGKDDPYKAWIEGRLLLTGSVPYGKCPQTLDHDITHGVLPPKWYRGQHPVIPPHLRDRNPCRTAANGGPINQANCCACIEELIAYRKKWQAEQMQALEVKTEAMLQNEASRGIVGAVKDMADVVRELKGAPAKSSRKPKHPDEEEAGE